MEIVAFSARLTPNAANPKRAWERLAPNVWNFD
jgi:hypothetical protein